MLNFLDFSGLRTFFNKLKAIFLPRNVAASTYSTQADTRKYIRSIVKEGNILKFLDGNGNVVCEMIFDGEVTTDEDNVGDVEITSLFNGTYKKTTDDSILNADINSVFGGAYDDTVGGGDSISDDDIKNLFN